MNKKTLYIVGAGASHEAKLPTGDKLKNEISRLLDIKFNNGYNQSSGDRLITEAYRLIVRKLNLSKEDINPHMKAGWRIRDALHLAISIDNFIDAHKDDEKIELCGKLAIVRSILEAEQRSLMYIDNSNSNNKLNYTSLEKTWYTSFFKLLTENCAKNELKKRFESISFIVFNYDRCIEHFLYNSLQNYYGISLEESAELVNSIEIHHPYGVVGNLPWQEGKSVQFGATPSATQLIKLAEQIKTFTEGTNPESSEIIAIRKSTAAAENIVFLGFAYHKQNLILISPNSLSPEKFGTTNYYGTALGISDSDCKSINEELRDFKHTDIFEKNINNTLNCSSLFKEYWRSLSLT